MKAEYSRDKELIEKIIDRCDYCVIAMSDGGTPYAIPMSFARLGDRIYLHSGPGGEKERILSGNNRVRAVFVEPEREVVWRDEHVGCSYSMYGRSVTVDGTVSFVGDIDEKRRIMYMIMRKYTQNEVRFSDPAIKNVVIWILEPTEMVAKTVGIEPYKKK